MRSVFLDLLNFIGNDAYIAVRISVISLAIFAAVCQKLFFDLSPWDYLGRLFDNPFFGATFSIVGLGASLAALQQIWSLGQHFYSSYLTCSIEIPSTDESFQWVLQWVYAKRLENPLHLTVETVHVAATSMSSSVGSRGSTSRFEFAPSAGVHHFM